MISEALYEEGLAYAEENLLNEEANHLKVDKALIRARFQLDGKEILDFGCGMGGMSLWYGRNWDCRVHAVDIDAHHIQIAKDLQKRHGGTSVRFEVRNILLRPLEQAYDMIMLNDVAEHIQLPVLEKIFRALSNHLKEDGGIFVSYPPWKSPYASHVQHVVGIPWCQFLPERWLFNLIERNNRVIVGEEESDLLQAYKGLNHLTHDKLVAVTSSAGLRVVFRKSHSIVNRIPGLGSVNLRMFPFDYLITKEFVYFKKENGSIHH